MNEFLVMAYTEGLEGRRIASSFSTRKEAVDTLNRVFGKKGRRIKDNMWEDSLGQRFYIEENKEVK